MSEATYRRSLHDGRTITRVVPSLTASLTSQAQILEIAEEGESTNTMVSASRRFSCSVGQPS